MSGKVTVRQNEDHVWPNFKWKKAPSCKCGRIKSAVENRFIFVSNVVDGETDADKHNFFYMLPVTADGQLVNSDGVAISHCPWCGDKIDARKKR